MNETKKVVVKPLSLDERAHIACAVKKEIRLNEKQETRLFKSDDKNLITLYVSRLCKLRHKNESRLLELNLDIDVIGNYIAHHAPDISGDLLKGLLQSPAPVLLNYYFDGLTQKQTNDYFHQMLLVGLAETHSSEFIQTAIKYLCTDTFVGYAGKFIIRLIERGDQKILWQAAPLVHTYQDKFLRERYLSALNDNGLKNYIKTYTPKISPISLLWERIFKFEDPDLVIKALPTFPCFPQTANVLLKHLIVSASPKLHEVFSENHTFTDNTEDIFILKGNINFLKCYYASHTPGIYALSDILRTVQQTDDIAERFLICFAHTRFKEYEELWLLRCNNKKLIKTWLKNKKLHSRQAKAQLLDSGDKELISLYLETAKA